MNSYHKHIRSFPPSFWVVIGATLMNQSGNMGLVFLVLYLHQSLGFSLAYASSAFAAFSASMFMSSLFGGSFIDKFGAARIMILSIFANGIGLLIFSTLHHYTLIILMCLCWGLCFGIFRPASQAFISEVSTPGMHKITFSVFRLAINLGMSIGPAIGGYLAYHSFSAIYIANGIANLLAGTILIIGLGKTHWHSLHTTSRAPLEWSLKWLRHDRTLCLFMLGLVLTSLIFFQHESTLAVFLNRDLHLSLSFYGSLFTINTLLIVFFELPLNVALMNWSYRTHFMLGSVFIMLGFAGLAFATTATSIILLTISWTVGEMILFPSASSYIADIAPDARRGSYMALFATSSNLGMLLGPFGGALIMEHASSRGLWLACGLVGLLALCTFHYTKEPH